MQARVSTLPGLWRPSEIESPYVMIILHGGAEHVLDIVEALNLPRLNYLLLQNPTTPESTSGLPGSADALEKVITLLEERGFSREHIFWLGFAEGCRRALEFGVRAQHDYRGFIGISGCCGETEALIRDMTTRARKSAWFISHGNMDEVVSVETVRVGIKSLAAHGLPVMYCEFEKGHGIDFETEVPMIRQWIKRRL